MQRARVVPLYIITLLALAFAPAASADPPATLVYWDDGWVKFTIDATHVAHYRFHAYGWGSEGRPDRSVDAKVSDADFNAMTRVFSAQSACDLHGTGRHPVPEEHSATLSLALPTLQCTITMLSNDWSATPRGTAVSGAVGAVIRKVAP